MPRKLNILLERLLAYKTYTTTTGNTKPSISYGFFGHVTFEPWKSFGQLVDSAILQIERLSDDDIAVADRRLAAARNEIALKRRKRERLNAVEMRKDVEGQTVNSASVVMNELGMEEPRTKKKRKTADSDPAMRGPVTNSQSNLTQYTVMAAIGCLLDNIYPDLVLIMDQSMVAGEYLTRTIDDDSSESSDVDIEKAKTPEEVNGQPSEVYAHTVDGTLPEGNVKDRAETISAVVLGDHPIHQPMSALPSTATNQAAEDGTEAVTRTISEALPRNRVSERPSIFRRERISQEPAGAEISSSQEMRAREHTEGGLQLLRRSARLAVKHYPFTEPPAGIIKLRQTADQALFLASKPATAKVPVCCFELKGPKLLLML